jgi:hypothetical protein
MNMNKVNYLSRLNSASFFTKNTLRDIVGGNDDGFNSNVARWIENGNLIQLKKGLYVTTEYYSGCSSKQDYIEFVANVLKKPSYLSGEYVLQKYGILSESVFSMTSVTRKKTRIYNNKLGVFGYSNIKKNLFVGFNIVSKSGYEIKEATKVKALFDYLYFKLRMVQEINQEVIDSLRLNLETFLAKDYVDLKYFIMLSGVKKFDNLIKFLQETSK